MPEVGDDLPKAAGPPRARTGLPTRSSSQPDAPAASVSGGRAPATSAAGCDTPGKVALGRREASKRARDDAGRAAAAADADRVSELETALESELARAYSAEADRDRMIEVVSALRDQLAVANRALVDSSRGDRDAAELMASLRRKSERLQAFKTVSDGLTAANASLKGAVATSVVTAASQAAMWLRKVAVLEAALESARVEARTARLGQESIAPPPVAPGRASGDGASAAGIDSAVAGSDCDDDDASAASDESAEARLNTMRELTAETSRLLAAPAAAAPPPSAEPYAAAGGDGSDGDWDVISGSTGGRAALERSDFAVRRLPLIFALK